MNLSLSLITYVSNPKCIYNFNVQDRVDSHDIVLFSFDNPFSLFLRIFVQVHFSRRVILLSLIYTSL